MDGMCEIRLKVMDSSPLQMAYALKQYYEDMHAIKDFVLIDLEELSEHINMYVQAQRKVLEVSK